MLGNAKQGFPLENFARGGQDSPTYASRWGENKYLMGRNFHEFFFRPFAGINFRELGFNEDFAGISFRELSLTKYFAGINFRQCALYKDSLG